MLICIEARRTSRRRAIVSSIDRSSEYTAEGARVFSKGTRGVAYLRPDPPRNGSLRALEIRETRKQTRFAGGQRMLWTQRCRGREGGNKGATFYTREVNRRGESTRLCVALWCTYLRSRVTFRDVHYTHRV